MAAGERQSHRHRINQSEEQIMTSTQTTPTQTGIVVSTPLVAGGWSLNHAEGIVVSTPLVAGGWSLNHAEGVVSR